MTERSLHVAVESADLDAVLYGRRWVAVWRTHLSGRIADDVCPQLSNHPTAMRA